MVLQRPAFVPKKLFSLPELLNAPAHAPKKLLSFPQANVDGATVNPFPPPMSPEFAVKTTPGTTPAPPETNVTPDTDPMVT